MGSDTGEAEGPLLEHMTGSYAKEDLANAWWV